MDPNLLSTTLTTGKEMKRESFVTYAPTPGAALQKHLP